MVWLLDKMVTVVLVIVFGGAMYGAGYLDGKNDVNMTPYIQSVGEANA